MKKIKCVAIIIAIALTTILSVYAAETHTVWYASSYDGYATAYASATSAAASARGNSESGFVRAILATTSERLSDSDEQPAGTTATKGFSIYEFDNPYATLTTSYASAWIGNTEIVCSQYY